MSKFKKAKVVMLPTNEKIRGQLTLNKNYPSVGGNCLKIRNSTWFDSFTKNKWVNQHLYITSDDKIKEGDFYILDDSVYKCEHGEAEVDYLKESIAKKIIATTDRWLYPKLSQSFIEKYVEEYNKGNIITDILVEYGNKLYCDTCQDILVYNNRDWKCIHCKTVHTDCVDVLKINPKDNTINIKELKDSWNREEIDNILEEYRQFAWKRGVTKIDLENWKKENLYKL